MFASGYRITDILIGNCTIAGEIANIGWYAPF